MALPQAPARADRAGMGPNTEPAGSTPILAAYDGSPAAYRATSWAAAEAARSGRPLRIARIVRWPLPELDGLRLPADARTRPSTPGDLDAVVEHCRRLVPGADVQVETLSGDPVALLTKLADESALTVLGASGQTMSGWVLLGSTAAEVARRVGPPVVVVRHEPPCDGRPVVIGADGSPDGRAAVRAGFAFAERAGSPVEVVHAWSDLPVEALGGPAAFDATAARRDAAALLSEQVADARRQHPELEVRELALLDRPTVTLLARAVGAALLVVGRHGRAHPREVPLGSVSHALLHYAHCPVMLVG